MSIEALVQASFAGDIHSVMALLHAGVSPNQVDPRTGHTPLTAAIEGAHVAVVDLLLDAGAEPNAADGTGMPPIHTAIDRLQDGVLGHGLGTLERDGLRIIDRLIAHGADPRVRSTKGETALQLLAEHDDYELTQMLLEHLQV